MAPTIALVSYRYSLINRNLFRHGVDRILGQAQRHTRVDARLQGASGIL
jgi:hypothetical protein